MKRLDLTGKIFGKLVIESFSHSAVSPAGQKRAMWNAICSCGVKKVVSSGNLRFRNVSSCGCVKKEGRNKKEQGLASFNSKFSSYKNGAKKRNLSFCITKEQFKAIVEQPCFYCGSENSTFHQAANCNGGFLSNGIDRVDSMIGYELNNCVSCCPTCNRMKLDLSYEEFVEHMKKVLQHLRKV